jgi:hypothetical protein
MQIEVDAEVSSVRPRPGNRSVGFQFDGYRGAWPQPHGPGAARLPTGLWGRQPGNCARGATTESFW